MASEANWPEIERLPGNPLIFTVVDISRGPIVAGHFFQLYLRFNRVWKVSGSPRDTGGLVFGELTDPYPVQGSKKAGIPLVHNTFKVLPSSGNVAFSALTCSSRVGRWLMDNNTAFAHQYAVMTWRLSTDLVNPVKVVSPPFIPAEMPIRVQC